MVLTTASATVPEIRDVIARKEMEELYQRRGCV